MDWWGFLILLFIWGAISSYVDDVAMKINTSLTVRERLSVVGHFAIIALLVALFVETYGKVF